MAQSCPSRREPIPDGGKGILYEFEEVRVDALLKEAVRQLGVDVPVMGWEVEDGRVRLVLYGGKVVEWDMPVPAPAAGDGEPAPAKRSRAAKKQTTMSS